MKLEFKNIAGEEVAFIILDCEACGAPLPVPERDLKTSRPLECSACCHVRPLSYREYVTITDRYSAALLGFLVVQFQRNRRNRLNYTC